MQFANGNSDGGAVTDVLARNLELQVEWYGEPLGDRFRRLLGRTRLSQAQLAGVLGLSAPMLSQLMSGHRAKISNPAVLARLLQLESIANDTRWDGLSPEEQQQRLDQVRAAQRSSLTIETGPEIAPAPAADPVAAVQAVLRAVASATEIEAAAKLLAPEHPELAEALRVLGTSRTPEARAYYTRVTREG
jgi:transcriptional regulator with XRE-family HTH domain